MTAEVAVLNRQGVALAADSAVTIDGHGGPKIFSSADKIFLLSKYQPVAAMIYGQSDFMSVPWETIIKVYREELGERSFPALQDYAADFRRFLAEDDMLIGTEQRELFAYDAAADLFGAMRDRILTAVDRESDDRNDGISMKEARRVALDTLRAFHRAWKKEPDREGVTGQAKRLLAAYEDQIDQARQDVFADFDFTPTALRQLREIVAFRWLKANLRGDSGIVISGFGDRDVFPRLVSYELDGVLLDHVVWWPYSEVRLGPQQRAFVHGFAQADMVHLFMEGVARQYEEFIEGYVAGIANEYQHIALEAIESDADRGPAEAALSEAAERLGAAVNAEFRERRRRQYVDPVLDVVASLPKDELGSMAESLVTLASLKQRVSMEHETVGGPVDVAVITRGDGLVWTQRKHYFDASLNHHFFTNYYRGSR